MRNCKRDAMAVHKRRSTLLVKRMFEKTLNVLEHEMDPEGQKDSDVMKWEE